MKPSAPLYRGNCVAALFHSPAVCMLIQYAAIDCMLIQYGAIWWHPAQIRSLHGSCGGRYERARRNRKRTAIDMLGHDRYNTRDFSHCIRSEFNCEYGQTEPSGRGLLDATPALKGPPALLLIQTTGCFPFPQNGPGFICLVIPGHEFWKRKRAARTHAVPHTKRKEATG